jgi:DNA polymerase
MNDRGVTDRPRRDRGGTGIVADIGTERANVVLRELTNGEVSEVTNHQRLTAWLQSEGSRRPVWRSRWSPKCCWIGSCPKMSATVLETSGRDRAHVDGEAGELPRRRWERRSRAGLLAYHAASTGRWGGRLVQPQNFPRGEVEGRRRADPV